MNLRLTSKAPGGSEYKMVGFLVGDVRYGIDIMQIREIINPVEFVQMPATPPHVLGVADHREAVVPIIDLRSRFGLESFELTRQSKWILVKIEERDIGLQVDQVTQVLKVTHEQYRDRRSLLNNSEEFWIKDVFSDEKGLVFEIDLDAIINLQKVFLGLEGQESEEL